MALAAVQVCQACSQCHKGSLILVGAPTWQSRDSAMLLGLWCWSWGQQGGGSGGQAEPLIPVVQVQSTGAGCWCCLGWTQPLQLGPRQAWPAALARCSQAHGLRGSASQPGQGLALGQGGEV